MTKASSCGTKHLLIAASSGVVRSNQALSNVLWARSLCRHDSRLTALPPGKIGAAQSNAASRESVRQAADKQRPRYGGGSGERGTPGLVQSDRWAWAKRIVAQRNGPDPGQVPLERTKRMSLGRDRRRGDEDDDVVEVGVIPEAGDPGRIGEIRVGQCSQTGKRPEQRNHDEPTHRHSDERHRAVLRVAPRDWRWRRQRDIVVRRRSQNTTMERHYKTGHLKKS